MPSCEGVILQMEEARAVDVFVEVCSVDRCGNLGRSIPGAVQCKWLL